MSTKREAMRAAEEASAGRALDTYPLRLFASHMAEIFGISVKQFYAQDAAGAFLWAENKPRIGRKSWSRERVREYFAGEVKGITSRLRRAS